MWLTALLSHSIVGANMRSEHLVPAKETDLYNPLRDYLLSQGYTVRSEVKGCDAVAERDGDVIVFELKRNLSISLLAQAVDRQRAFASVYAVVPHPGKRTRSREWSSLCRLLKRLELGLVLVDFGEAGGPPVAPAVEVAFHPAPPHRRTEKRVRQATLSELHGRSIDLNQGGMTGRKIVTAYRERAVQIACYLDALGSSAPARLRHMGTAANTGAVLADNFYGWFQRVERGIYSLTARGREDLGQYPELRQWYSTMAREKSGRREEGEEE